MANNTRCPRPGDNLYESDAAADEFVPAEDVDIQAAIDAPDDKPAVARPAPKKEIAKAVVFREAAPVVRRPDIGKITYSRRFNMGDYQHEEFTVELLMDENSGTPEGALLWVRQLVADHCTQELRRRAREAQAVKKSNS